MCKVRFACSTLLHTTIYSYILPATLVSLFCVSALCDYQRKSMLLVVSREACEWEEGRLKSSQEKGEAIHLARLFDDFGYIQKCIRRIVARYERRKRRYRYKKKYVALGGREKKVSIWKREIREREVALFRSRTAPPSPIL